ncbi:MAG: hypothetical protein IT496_01590 [Gammaproteobacteria bacterium]|nr:hypothetical protein [Gammaproteobacteria bacterium]MCG3144246.1 hypothetical protein [Gammaproteobacteria bacterium]
MLDGINGIPIARVEDVSAKPGLTHAAWAVLALVACAFLVLTRQTGHPPAIILVPYVLVAWVAGHGLIFGVQCLAAKGRRMAARASTEDQPWPVGLRLALVGTGIGTLVGITQVIGTVLQGRWYPYHDVGLWAAMLAVWVIHGSAFAGLLLRRRWSRLLSTAVAIGWALLLGRQIAGQFTTTASTDTAGVIMASGLIVILLLVAGYLAASRRAKAFLVH